MTTTHQQKLEFKAALHLEINPVVKRSLRLNNIELGEFHRSDSLTSNSSGGDSVSRKKTISFKNLRQIATKSLKDPSTPRGKTPMAASSFGNESDKALHFTRRSCYKKFKQMQKVVYLMMEEPTSTLLSKLIFALILFGILFTTVDTIIQSTLGDDEPEALNYIESAISIGFIVEYCLRLFSATAFGEPVYKCLIKPFNIIDLVSTVPFFLEIATENTEGLKSLRVIRVVRLVRILRVLKISRYIRGANTFIDGIKRSMASFGFLVLLMVLLDVVFATLFYYAEIGSFFEPIAEDPNRKIDSLLDAMWVVIVTLSSVGYGELSPQTTLGRVIAVAFAVTGMLLFAVPVAVLGNNFQDAYTRRLETDRIEHLKEAVFRSRDHLNDAQREMLFMSERVHTIDQTNDKIMELLTKSKKLYQNVSRDIRHLYKSIYAEERELEKRELEKREVTVVVDSPLLNKSMNSRIQVMEKLMKAKRKIKITNLFKMPQNRTSQSQTHTNKEDDSSFGDLRVPDDEAENSGSASPRRAPSKKSIPFLAIDKRKQSNHDEEIYVTTSYVPYDENDEQTNVLPTSTFKNKMNLTDTYVTNLLTRGHKKERGRKGRAPSMKKSIRRQKSVFRIKSNSVGNENKFIKYYNEKLDFLSNSLLQELILSKNDEDISSEEEEEDNYPRYSPAGRGYPRYGNEGERTNIRIDILLKDRPRQNSHAARDGRKEGRSLSLAISQSSSPPNRAKKKVRLLRVDKKRRSGVPAGGDPQMWELADKILDNLQRKGKLGMLRYSSDDDRSFSQIHGLDSQSSNVSRPRSYDQIPGVRNPGWNKKLSCKINIDEAIPSVIDEDEADGTSSYSMRSRRQLVGQSKNGDGFISPPNVSRQSSLDKSQARLLKAEKERERILDSPKEFKRGILKKPTIGVDNFD